MIKRKVEKTVQSNSPLFISIAVPESDVSLLIIERRSSS